jgi:hypothetical protein
MIKREIFKHQKASNQKVSAKLREKYSGIEVEEYLTCSDVGILKIWTKKLR